MALDGGFRCNLAGAFPHSMTMGTRTV
jgi:hypothetical protein